MDKKRVAVVGYGGMGSWHAKKLLISDVAEVAGIWDIDEAKREAAKEKGIFVYSSFEDLLADKTVDIVTIATPNEWHMPLAVAAMEAGFHVFCEKPDAVSIAEAAKMKDASERTGKILMVMRNNRYRETAKYLKQFIGDGRMGEVYAARCGWQRRRGIPGKGGWFTTKAQSGGGPLIDLGVHMIDLALWLMGNPKPVAVTGCTYSKFAGNDLSDSDNSKFGDKAAGGVYDVEDLAMGFVRMDNGACLTIECSWASNIEKERRFVELYGTKAGLKWDTEKLTLFEERGGTLIDSIPKLPEVSKGHEKNLRHFVDVVLNGAEPMFVPEQGVDMVKLLCALYESAATGKEVQL